ncbi:uncharacterized protein BJ171DRAFT_520189 [Polychytrium aggregatum]|uniref:uncharacterized protein n=1 Tax=Polychytrium aggregatum TaxID=110093 RepID=UPI0022FED1F6|nr:uncharacterized protein BJ171DRAFT_520189 [Polychytrium aggregatum]KAI9197397.1 hypothetical protein BJ171DRAFT_520189 [Polychytrium aggregatum]
MDGRNEIHVGWDGMDEVEEAVDSLVHLVGAEAKGLDVSQSAEGLVEGGKGRVVGEGHHVRQEGSEDIDTILGLLGGDTEGKDREGAIGILEIESGLDFEQNTVLLTGKGVLYHRCKRFQTEEQEDGLAGGEGADRADLRVAGIVEAVDIVEDGKGFAISTEGDRGEHLLQSLDSVGISLGLV